VKSYLAVREIEYDSVDVSSDPTGYQQMRALGAITTPVVAFGDRWIGGAAFDRLDDFFATHGRSMLGEPKHPHLGEAVGNIFTAAGASTVLTEWQLADRLDTILAKGERYMRSLPSQLLPLPLPERGKDGRTLRGLAWHIGQVAQDPLRAANGIAIVKSMHEYDPPDDLDTGNALAERASEIRVALAALLAPGSPLPTGLAEYFNGPYSFHGLLERTTWHVATHVRQLAWMLVHHGVDNTAGLTAAETADLPMPMYVWK
jgi:hypothetical protein